MKQMNPLPMPVAVAYRRYFIQLTAAMVCYAILLIISLKLMREVPAGWRQVLVALTPVVPIAFVLGSVIKLFSRIDELQRRIHLEALALSAGINALLGLTCGFLQNVGMPMLSGFWTWGSLVGLWGVFVIILQRRYR